MNALPNSCLTTGSPASSATPEWMPTVWWPSVSHRRRATRRLLGRRSAAPDQPTTSVDEVISIRSRYHTCTPMPRIHIDNIPVTTAVDDGASSSYTAAVSIAITSRPIMMKRIRSFIGHLI